MPLTRRPYALLMVVRKPSRYLPAILAVAFSALLVALQIGMLLGFLASAVWPIERIRAHLWTGSRGLAALGWSQPIPEAWWDRVASRPEVESVEPYVFAHGLWKRPDGGVEQCYFIGSHLADGSIGQLSDLNGEQRTALGRIGTVATHDTDALLLGLAQGEGEVGELNGRRVDVVAIMPGDYRGAAMMPGVVCSARTARAFARDLRAGETTYLIARCRQPSDADRVAAELRAAYPEMGTYTSGEIAWRTQLYYLTKTRAGLILGYSAALGLLVGGVISAQTFYGATAAAWREFAVLRALGIPRRRIAGLLMIQAVAVTVAGLVVALPLTLAMRNLASDFNITVLLPPWLLMSVAGVMFAAELAAGVGAIRSLRTTEPVALLR